ncbi:hypothetical protein [Veronia pacifica]|uniref:hypothetical protein n=1 Tax=Veronia pacifica TaxID=1080227 RepID=UPI001586A601|nr:hypothetical protein [Veronia pacifica]
MNVYLMEHHMHGYQEKQKLQPYYPVKKRRPGKFIPLVVGFLIGWTMSTIV